MSETAQAAVFFFSFSENETIRKNISGIIDHEMGFCYNDIRLDQYRKQVSI
ncbi:hypothetical protein [Bacillus pumilus]|uniref:hypothetical protein n=1 Tax=Bacillus pumilus TaxID=1408 RepID=UPI0025A2B544|nr:hypothetical protein [Bacillus pumilus]